MSEENEDAIIARCTCHSVVGANAKCECGTGVSPERVTVIERMWFDEHRNENSEIITHYCPICARRWLPHWQSEADFRRGKCLYNVIRYGIIYAL